jgi:hypothetical protein
MTSQLPDIQNIIFRSVKNENVSEAKPIDKTRIYLREFASEQITPKEQSDELPSRNTSKDKVVGPRYKDYFSQ